MTLHSNQNRLKANHVEHDDNDIDTHLFILVNHFATIPDKKKNKLSARAALIRYGIGAMSQRCGDLIRMGFPIQKEWATRSNRRGKKVRFMEYFM